MKARLDGLLRRGLRWRFFYGASLVFFRATIVFLSAVFLVLLAELLHPSTPAFRRWMEALILAASFGWSLRRTGASGFSRRSVALALGRDLRPPDRLLNLWELLRRPAPVPGPFVGREASALAPALDALRPRVLLLPRRWGREALQPFLLLGSFLALAVLLPAGVRFAAHRVLWPWGREESWIALSPGDRRVPSGESVTVSALPRVPSEGAPELFVREEGGPWQRRALLRAQDGSYRCVLDRIVEPLLYRARQGGLWTGTRRLTPYLPPRFARIRLRVKPPAYTGLPAEEWENVLSVRAAAGSALEGEGRLDAPVRSARLLTEAGADVPLSLTGGKEVRFRTSIRRSGSWSFRFVSAGGDASETALSVDAVPDEPPALRILSPEGDAVLEPGERLALVYEASDDHGLARVRLVLRRSGAPEERRSLSADPGVREETLTPARLGVGPGDGVEVWLEAEDGNPSGPGVARSRVLSVKVVSHEADRRRREEAMERWRGALLAARTDEEVLRGKLAAAAPDWQALAGRQEMAAEGIRELTEKLESLAREMEADPAADPWLAAEQRASAEELRDLLEGALPKALGAMKGARREDAAGDLDDVVKELDRVASASEEAEKGAKARALGKQDGLADASRELAEGLGGKALSPEDRRKMDAVMKEIAEGLRAVAEALQKTPGLLPDVPPGQDASQVLKMSDMMKNLNEAKEAMDRGDAAAAAQAAQRLLDQVRQMQKILAEGGRRFGGEEDGMSAPLAEEVRKAMETLRTLVRRQDALKARTQEVRDGAVLRLKAAQEAVLRSTNPASAPTLPSWSEEDRKALAAEAADQETLRGDTGSLRRALEEARKRTSLLPAKVLGRLDDASAAMDAAARALRAVLPPGALAAQDEALRLLQDDDDAMGSMGQSGAGGKFPSGSAGSKGSAGFPAAFGAKPAGPTRLPRAEDYRPPREFREELLKALEEKYPRRDQGLIEEYFKRWKK